MKAIFKAQTWAIFTWALTTQLFAHVTGERITDPQQIEAHLSYVIINKATGGALEPDGRTVLNLANLAPAQPDATTWQLWRFEAIANNGWYIFNRRNDKVILVEGGNKNPGANIVQDRNRRSARNTWELESAESGYFRLINRNSNLPLAVSDPSSDWGMNVHQAARSSDDAQLWAIYRARAPAEETPDFSQRGFATAQGLVTGGAGGEVVVVSTVAELKHYISRPQPTIILVSGTFDLPPNPDTPHSNPNGRMYTVSSDKTIIGLPGAHIRLGGFNISRAHNIIIRNLTFSAAHDDSVNIEHGSTRVWVDHNEFFAGADGLVDVKRESDFITVSWNIFNQHDKTALLGHDDNHTADRGHLRVTYHHNWFRDANQRLPRVRYARTHVVNNLYENIGGYCMGIGVEARIIAESNFVVSANSGYTLYDKAAQPGFFRDINGVYSGLNNDLEITSDSGIDWAPEDYYDMTANHVLNVPNMVRAYAGPGVLTTEELGIHILPPQIVTAPATRTVNIGTSTTFEVEVSGTGPLFFEWSFNGQLLLNHSAAQLTLTNINAADEGLYSVTVLNGFGESDSAEFQLMVDPTVLPPLFEQKPQSQIVQSGGTATFNAGVNGTAPITIQWFKNGEPLLGQTGPTLQITAVDASDAAIYTVRATNSAGNIESPPFFLAVPPQNSSVLLNDSFADGNRTGQNLPGSAAWFTSSGSSNFTATQGSATQNVSSSRTIIGYFTPSSASPLVVGTHQSIELKFDFSFSGFDSAQPADFPTFRPALLRSVANPTATNGTGFQTSGTPNTNARVNADFGSNNPSNNPFNLYQGYAAFSVFGPNNATTAGFLARRDGIHPSLLGNSTPFTPLGQQAPTPSGIVSGSGYRGILTISNTGSGHLISYSVYRIVDGTIILTMEASDPEATFTSFDTVAFHLTKNGSSPTYNFTLLNVQITLISEPDTSTFAGWMSASGLPPSLQGHDTTLFTGDLPNMLKYAMGLDPLIPASRDQLPKLDVIQVENYLYPVFSFQRNQAAGNVSLTVENCRDLSFQSDLGASIIEVRSGENGTESVHVRSNVSLTSEPHQFMRLVARFWIKISSFIKAKPQNNHQLSPLFRTVHILAPSPIPAFPDSPYIRPSPSTPFLDSPLSCMAPRLPLPAFFLVLAPLNSAYALDCGFQLRNTG
ncbi:MAG: immunoglobulin domain-containing protein, partial [Verrucomicrobia bacterium]|nr:immunoglobulin domain-containing protein [Verrucomicrobiota bacterium]